MHTTLRFTLVVGLLTLSLLLAAGLLMHLSDAGAAQAAALQSPPDVVSVVPGVIVNTAEAAISIEGTGFVSVPLVLLDDTPMADVGWVATTTLTATVPAGFPVGIYDVTVQNGDGLSDTLAQTLVVRYPAPVLTAIDPVTGTYGRPLVLTLTGTDFISLPTVLLGNATYLEVGFVSSTTLTATLASELVPDYYDVTVANPGPGDVSDWLPNAFTLYSPVPDVGGVAPDLTFNDMDTPIVITGTNFAPTPEVMLGGTALADVTWVSMTQLTAEVPWGMDPTVYSLTVTNPVPGGYAATLTPALTMKEGFNTWTTGGPYGGNIQALVRHPAISTTLYALVMNVGVFESTDAGGTWEMILREDWLKRISFDADDPSVIYVGGDGGLLRTMDGGLTWSEIVPTDTWTQAYNLYRPLAHPTAGCVVYAGKRTPDEPESEPGGVYRSDNCGTTWALVGRETTGLTDTHVVDMAFHPDSVDQMVLGTQSGNVFWSDDGGASWAWQGRVDSRIEQITYNPFGTHEAWILTGLPQGESSPPYVYRSGDLTTWMAVDISDGGGNRYVVRDLDFVTEDTIWAAMGYGVISTDGGATWSDAGWDGALPEDNVTSFFIDPDAPDVVYAGHSIGGVYKSEDGGTTWAEANQDLAGVIPYALAVAPDDPDTLYAYTTRGLLKSQNGGRAWQSLDKWVGGRQGERMVAVDPITATRVYLSQPCEDAFCLWISEDAGTNWREVTTALPADRSGHSTTVEVIAPHPAQPGLILAGVTFFPAGDDAEADGGIYISEDHGEHWAFLAATLVFEQVADIVYDAADPYLIYAGTGGTGVWRSKNGGNSWYQLNVPGLAPPVGVESMATHPNRENVLLARLMSSADTLNPGGDLHISEDAGATWTQLDENTSDDGLVFAPPAAAMPPYQLYTGCGRSVCRSMDVGRSWGTIYGVPRPSSMVASTDGERTVIYAASPGGMAAAETQAAGRLGITGDIPGRGNVMGSGVYRTALRPLDQHVYLPVALRN